MITNTDSSSMVLFPEASPVCLGNTLSFIGNKGSLEKSVDTIDLESIDGILGFFREDLLNGGKFYKQLLNYAIRETGDFQIAEDAIANFYSNLVKKVRNGSLNFKYPVDVNAGINGNPKVRPWAFTCVNNTCRDLSRRRKSKINRITTDKCDVTKVFYPDKIDDPSEIASRDELRQIILQSVDYLQEPQRQVLQLCYFQGLRYREAGDVLGIPLGTVKSRMHSALIDLKKILSHYNSESLMQ